MTDRNYGAIRDSEKAVAFIERITNESTKPIAFDIEAGYVGEDKELVALQQFHPDYIVVGISFTVSTEWARYIPLAHDDGGNVDDIISVGRALWAMLNTGRGVAHNAAYELKGMSRWFRENFWNDPEIGEGVRATNGFFPILSDTMLEVWLSAEYDPLRIGKDLKSVALNAFGLQMTKFMDLFPAEDSDLGPGTKRGKTRFVRFNTRNSRNPTVINYACEDSVAALLIHEKHYADWKDKFIYKTEMSLLPVLCEMEMGPVDRSTGGAIGNMYFDWVSIARKADEVARFGKLMNEEILQMLSERLGRVVNINLASVPQLSRVLYSPAPDGIGLPVKQRSEKTGAPSTSDDALRVIAKNDPVVKKILEFRQVNKLFGSYLNKFLVELNYMDTGYVFPNHNQFGALTGRMSVDQVSYQQWPKPYHFELGDGTTFDLNFRDLFISPPEHRIVGFDFSQVELRVLAGMANERAMLEAFASGVDIHKATASSMMGVPLDKVTKKQRAVGKALANSEVILTPSGWMRMGDVQVGDEVVVPSGGTSLVEAVFPQGERDIFLVRFEDGSEVRADAEHLWPVRHITSHESQLLTTQQIIDSGLTHNTGKGNVTWKWYIENVSPLEFEGSSDLNVQPYLLGLLLGDGSLSGPAVSISVGDEDDLETLTEIEDLLENGVDLRKIVGGYVFTSSTPGAYRNSLDRDLRVLGLRGSKTKFEGRFGVRSFEKFAPQQYLFAGPEQRMELLRGLMDADATVDADGRALLTTTSKQLAEDAIFLARSLGGRAKIVRSRETTYTYPGEKKTGRLSYEVLIATPEVPFRLLRKASRWVEINGRKQARLPHKKIVSITPVGREHATCIRVADEEHEFITAGVTRTHNTLNFAVVYGSGPANIAELLSAQGDPTTKEAAQEMLEKYFSAFPGLRNWMGARVVEGREQGYVNTLFGRKFTVWEYQDSKEWIRSKGDRMCVNAPVQGGAADYMKIGMVRTQAAIHRAEREGRIPKDSIRLTLTIHDALEFLVHDSVDTQTVIDLINPCVSFPVKGLPVEIRADWHEGRSWGSVVEIKLDPEKRISGYAVEDVDQVFSTLEEAYAYQDKEHAGVEDTLSHVPDSSVSEEEPPWAHRTERPVEDQDMIATITITEMPTEAQWVEFLEWLKTRSGTTKVVLETPEGSLTFDERHHVDHDDQPHISLLLGGASLNFSAEHVDGDLVMSGIDL